MRLSIVVEQNHFKCKEGVIGAMQSLYALLYLKIIKMTINAQYVTV